MDTVTTAETPAHTLRTVTGSRPPAFVRSASLGMRWRVQTTVKTVKRTKLICSSEVQKDEQQLTTQEAPEAEGAGESPRGEESEREGCEEINVPF